MAASSSSASGPSGPSGPTLQTFADKFRRDFNALQKIQQKTDDKVTRILGQDSRIGSEKFYLRSFVRDPDELEAKLKSRAGKQGPFDNWDEIQDDIKDLVAVRIILLEYAEDLEAVYDVIRVNFDIANEISHPRPPPALPWYTAYHFQVKMESPSFYKNALMVEIQVMSPGMYELKEREHDLLHKELAGEPIADDLAAFEELYLKQLDHAQISKDVGNRLSTRRESSSLGVSLMHTPSLQSSASGVNPQVEDSRLPEPAKTEYECSGCKNKMPEADFHYFCTLRGNPITLHSPQSPETSIEVQMKLEPDGLFRKHWLPLKSFGPDNFLNEIRRLLNISPGSHLVIKWKVGEFQLRNRAYSTLDYDIPIAMHTFYEITGQYRSQLLLVSYRDRSPSLRNIFRRSLSGGLPTLTRSATDPQNSPKTEWSGYESRCDNYMACHRCHAAAPFCPDHRVKLSRRRTAPYTELTALRTDPPIYAAIKQEDSEALQVALTDRLWSHNDIPPLHLVARSGWAQGAKILLNYPGMLEDRDSRDHTPLMIAVRFQQAAIVDLLLRQGADVDAQRTENQATAMHIAAFSANVTIVRMLIAWKASVNALTKNLSSPLMVATMRGNVPVIRALLKAGANANEDGIHIDDGPESKSYLTASILHHAASTGEVELAQLLCSQRSIVVDNRDKEGTTPLMRACQKSKLNVALVLINAGADVNARNFFDMTPLLLAIRTGNKSLVSALINRGADYNFFRTASVGRGHAQSALSIAAWNGDLECVQLLLQNGADPRYPNYPDELHGEKMRWKDMPFRVGVPQHTQELILKEIRECKERLKLQSPKINSPPGFVAQKSPQNSKEIGFLPRARAVSAGMAALKEHALAFTGAR